MTKTANLANLWVWMIEREKKKKKVIKFYVNHVLLILTVVELILVFLYWCNFFSISFFLLTKNKEKTN